METNNADNLEMFSVEQHRFTIDPDAQLLPQFVEVVRQVIAIQNAHTQGARVCGVVVEMERPV